MGKKDEKKYDIVKSFKNEKSKVRQSQRKKYSGKSRDIN